jgi:hypothetical protein
VTNNFELVLTEGSARGVVGFISSGSAYLYYAGTICRPNCASAAPEDGVWLLKLTNTEIELAHPSSLHGAFQLASPTSGIGGVTINGTALYRLDGTANKMRIFDIANPAAPTQVGTVPQSGPFEPPIDASGSALRYRDNVILMHPARNTPENQQELYGAVFFQVDPANPFSVTQRGRVRGIVVLTGLVQSSTRTFLSTGAQGILRIDTGDLLFPRIDGGQEAPNNVIEHMRLYTHGGENYVIAVEPTSVTLFRLLQ